MNEEAISNKEELTEEEISDFSLPAEEVWSALDSDLLSSLFSEDFSEEDKPESVHASDGEDSSDIGYSGDIFIAENSSDDNDKNIKIIIDEIKKSERTIKLPTGKYHTEEIRSRLPWRKKNHACLERIQKGEQYTSKKDWKNAKRCFKEALSQATHLSNRELQLKLQIYCHEKLIEINQQLKKRKSARHHQQEKEKLDKELDLVLYKKTRREIETDLKTLDSQEYVLHAFARELRLPPVEKTRLTLAKLQETNDVLNKEEPFQSIIELVQSFNRLASENTKDLGQYSNLVRPIGELKSVLLTTIELYYKKVKTEKLTIDYSAIVLIEDKEIYRAAIDTTLKAIKKKIIPNLHLLKQLAFMLYQDKYSALTSNDCSKCMSLMCEELTDFETKRLEEQHASLNIIQALLDAWLYLGAHRFKGEQALPEFEFIEQNNKPGKEDKTQSKERPKLVEEYNRLYYLLDQIKNNIEDNGNLWFKAACARQTILHIGSNESKKMLTVRKGGYLAKGTVYLGAAVGSLLLATVITGQSIKAALSNTKEAGKEFIKFGHIKERRHRHYWLMRQFQSNIINFILITPSNANKYEARYQQQLAQLTDFLHLHRYFLFMAFTTLLDILNTNTTLLRGNLVDYSRCATLLTYCFASIDFSSNRGRRYVTIVLKELLSIHFKMCQKQEHSNFVPTLINVFSEFFPRFANPSEKKDDVSKAKRKGPVKDKSGEAPSKTKDKIKQHQSHKAVARVVVETVTNLLIYLNIRPEARDSCFKLLEHYATQHYTTLKKGNPHAASYKVAQVVFACLEELIRHDHYKERAKILLENLKEKNKKADKSYKKACDNNKKPMINIMMKNTTFAESRNLVSEAWSNTFPLDDEVRLLISQKDKRADNARLRDMALFRLECDQSKLETQVKHKGYQISEWGRRLFEKACQMLPLEKMPAEIQWEMYLRKHYQDDVNCNSVTLLSDEIKHIEHCFVNLAIVKQEKQREQVKQSTENKGQTPTLGREHYLNWYEDIHRSKDKEPIETKEIFNERKDEKDPRKRFPRKILVHGWAGIGKTTLLRKIAFEWAAKNLWVNKFKLVFWIRLRNLNRDDIASKTYLQDILEIELYDGTSASKKVSETMLADIMKYINSNDAENVLFLLDGFDELDIGRAIAKAIDNILVNERWHVIVTSRPTVTISAKFDSILETIGFTNKNIKVYIRQFFNNDAEKASQLIDFLKANPNIYGLAHIPINLELMCTAYKDGLSEKNFTSMTQLYKAIEEKLWYRMLDRMPSSSRLSDSENEEKKLKEKKKVANYLQKLAFECMKVNHYMLTKQDMLKAGEDTYYQRNQIPRLTFDYFKKTYLNKVLLSQFLHSPDVEQHKQQDYYFLHLTFQEYFAARYLSELLLSENKVKIREATDFIKTHKYEQRFQYLFLFTVGLLNLEANQEDEEYAENGQNALNLFFKIFFEKPRDLIGNNEALFLMRCLEEGQLLKKLEKKYRQIVWQAIFDIIWRSLCLDGYYIDADLIRMLMQCPLVIQSERMEKLLLMLLDNFSNGLTWHLCNNIEELWANMLPYCRLEFLHQTLFPKLIETLKLPQKSFMFGQILYSLNLNYEKLNSDNLLSLLKILLTILKTDNVTIEYQARIFKWLFEHLDKIEVDLYKAVIPAKSTKKGDTLKSDVVIQLSDVIAQFWKETLSNWLEFGECVHTLMYEKNDPDFRYLRYQKEGFYLYHKGDPEETYVLVNYGSGIINPETLNLTHLAKRHEQIQKILKHIKLKWQGDTNVKVKLDVELVKFIISCCNHAQHLNFSETGNAIELLIKHSSKAPEAAVKKIWQKMLNWLADGDSPMRDKIAEHLRSQLSHSSSDIVKAVFENKLVHWFHENEHVQTTAITLFFESSDNLPESILNSVLEENLQSWLTSACWKTYRTIEWLLKHTDKAPEQFYSKTLPTLLVYDEDYCERSIKLFEELTKYLDKTTLDVTTKVCEETLLPLLNYNSEKLQRQEWYDESLSLVLVEKNETQFSIRFFHSKRASVPEKAAKICLRHLEKLPTHVVEILRKNVFTNSLNQVESSRIEDANDQYETAQLLLKYVDRIPEDITKNILSKTLPDLLAYDKKHDIQYKAAELILKHLDKASEHVDDALKTLLNLISNAGKYTYNLICKKCPSHIDISYYIDNKKEETVYLYHKENSEKIEEIHAYVIYDSRGPLESPLNLTNLAKDNTQCEQILKNIKLKWPETTDQEIELDDELVKLIVSKYKYAHQSVGYKSADLFLNYLDKAPPSLRVEAVETLLSWLAHDNQHVRYQAAEWFNKYFDNIPNIKDCILAICASIKEYNECSECNEYDKQKIIDALTNKLSLSKLLKFPLLLEYSTRDAVWQKARKENLTIFCTEENEQFYLHYGQQTFDKIVVNRDIVEKSFLLEDESELIHCQLRLNDKKKPFQQTMEIYQLAVSKEFSHYSNQVAYRKAYKKLFVDERDTVSFEAMHSGLVETSFANPTNSPTDEAAQASASSSSATFVQRNVRDV